MSFIEPALTALRLDALDGLQIVDALDVAAAHHPPIDPDRPALLAQLYSRAVAGDVKLTLLNQYPPEHEVAIVQAAGTTYQQVIRLPLAEIDRRDDLAHLTTLYVPPLPQPSGYPDLSRDHRASARAGRLPVGSRADAPNIAAAPAGRNV